MRQAVQCLGPLGRAALVGLTAESMSIFPYTELINKEVEIIGVSDHLATELPALIEFARSGKLRFPPETLRVVDLDAGQINAALDALQDSIDHVRTVIIPRVMNWEMLTAIGQLAAVFVGIPSLIYLAVQIREQTKERRQSAVNVLTAQWGDLTCALYDSAELSAIFLRGCTIFRRSRSCLETQVQRVLQHLLKPLRSNVFRPLRGHTHGIVMGQDGANAERRDCLSGNTRMVEAEKTLAHGRVWPRRR